MNGLAARCLVPGDGSGKAAVLDEPLSFWGGMDVASGTVIDRHHPQHGRVLSGRVLVMPAGRGSSSSSSVIAEAIRAGTAPAAIVLHETDVIVAVGCLVAGELYGRTVPVVVLDRQAVIQDGEPARVRAEDGEATVYTGAR